MASALNNLSTGLALQPNKTTGNVIPSNGDPTTSVGGIGNGMNAGASSAPITQWSGGMDLPAMIAAATKERGGAMQDPSVGYWAGVAPQFEQRYGSGAANELYQRMEGKEASGAAAAPGGIYSAQNGYNYVPTPDSSSAASIPGLQGLNFNLMNQGSMGQLPGQSLLGQQPQQSAVPGMAQLMQQLGAPQNQAGSQLGATPYAARIASLLAGR